MGWTLLIFENNVFLVHPLVIELRPLYTLYTFNTDFPRKSVYDFQRKHGHDIDCHVLAPASTCSNTRASTFVTTRASTCITTRASMVLNGASTCSNTCASTCITTRASTCITTRASTCHYTRARLLFKNMHPGVQKGPDIRSKCVVTMNPTKAGQSGAVGTESASPGRMFLNSSRACV